mgnify:FL=1
MIFNIKITNTTPTVTEVHRQQGHLPRYFAAKANHINDEVFEISRRQWEEYYDINYVMLGHLNWVIKGQLEDRQHLLYTGNPTFDGGREPISIPGLLTQNRAAVRFLSRRIPAVKNYLADYKQFYIGV